MSLDHRIDRWTPTFRGVPYGWRRINELFLQTFNPEVATGPPTYDLAAHVNVYILATSPPIRIELTEAALASPPSEFAAIVHEDATALVQAHSLHTPPATRPPTKVVSPDLGRTLRFKRAVAHLYDRCCPICLEDYKPNEKIWHVHGKCAFHRRCLATHFRKGANTQCPLCRHECGIEANVNPDEAESNPP